MTMLYENIGRYWKTDNHLAKIIADIENIWSFKQQMQPNCKERLLKTLLVTLLDEAEKVVTSLDG